MKTIKDILLGRTSVRRYTRDKLSQEELEFIYKAIQNTPTSYNGQQFSVISVTDQDEKVLLYEITGQKQIKTCAAFLVFCADYNKIRVAADAIECPFPAFPDGSFEIFGICFTPDAFCTEGRGIFSADE